MTRTRELRRYMTQEERRLWSALRDRRLGCFKFRRQHEIGHYIVDFFCFELGLIVEVDGNQHDGDEQAWYDYRRTRWLHSQGYKVLRFRNRDVLDRSSQVIAVIEEAAQAGPHPSRRSR